MRGLLAALTLLTRVPAGRADWDEEDLGRSVAWLPIVGAAIGLVIGGAYVLLLELLPGLAAAGVATALGVMVTGALHEDGLADTADAFGAGVDRAETLRIMKDPTHGTFGVIALVLSVGLRVVALATLAASSALLVVPVAHALSRAGSASLIGAMPPASGDGLGAAHSRVESARRAWAGSLFAILVGAALLGWWAPAFTIMAGIAALVVGRLAMRRISGFTGDVLGAAQQMGEVSLLLLGAGLAQAGLISSPWWRS